MIRFADRHPIAFLAALTLAMASVGWMLRDTTPPTPVEPVRAVVPATAAPAVTVPPSSTAAATVAGGALGDGDVEVSSTTVVVPVTVAPVGDQIVALIHDYFGDAAPTAIRVFTCESGLDPNAVSPTNDHGIAQIHAPLWVAQFEAVTGAPFYDGVYDPHLNLQFARWLYDRSGFVPWACF